MMLQKISKNRLKWIRQLRQKKYRTEHGLYLISGLRAVQEALSAQNLKVKSVFIAQEHSYLLNQLPAIQSSEIFSLSKKEFGQIVEEKTPQGIAILVERPFKKLNMQQLPGRFIYLERVTDPGNLGTLMRSALWFGWFHLLLSNNSVDPYAPKTVRASAGSVAHLSIYENISLEKLEQLKKHGQFQLIAATISGGQKLNTFSVADKTPLILALGSEAHGLSTDLLHLSNFKVTIPKLGHGESLNLAMAGTIFLYHFSVLFNKTNMENNSDERTRTN